MTLSALSKIFNDAEHDAASLRQLRFLLLELCKKTKGTVFKCNVGFILFSIFLAQLYIAIFVKLMQIPQ